MTRLSVNINKVATLRNARGGEEPSVTTAAEKCQQYGADGITVHPRPDQRHITRQDVYDLKKVVNTEFNIEGNPTQDFIDLVLDVKPDQVTLVPDEVNAITSNAGWDTKKNQSYLTEVIATFQKSGIRCSIFLDPNPDMVESAKATGTDRIELYTEHYARVYAIAPEKAVKPYVATAEAAKNLGLGINAGHDLSLKNIEYFNEAIPYLDEVSIGHALISESLYLGLENTIQLYLSKLNRS